MAVEFVLAADRHSLRWKPRLHSKSRPAAFLAIIAMANRASDGLAGASGGKLAAAAGGGSSHRVDPKRAISETAWLISDPMW
jgi:hypothetical protein